MKTICLHLQHQMRELNDHRDQWERILSVIIILSEKFGWWGCWWGWRRSYTGFAMSFSVMSLAYTDFLFMQINQKKYTFCTLPVLKRRVVVIFWINRIWILDVIGNFIKNIYDFQELQSAGWKSHRPICPWWSWWRFQWQFNRNHPEHPGPYKIQMFYWSAVTIHVFTNITCLLREKRLNCIPSLRLPWRILSKSNYDFRWWL